MDYYEQGSELCKKDSGFPSPHTGFYFITFKAFSTPNYHCNGQAEVEIIGRLRLKPTQIFD